LRSKKVGKGEQGVKGEEKKGRPSDSRGKTTPEYARIKVEKPGVETLAHGKKASRGGPSGLREV